MIESQEISEELGAFLDEGPKRILVVDDEEAITRVLARMLERVGYECRIAFDAVQAKDLLGAESFALVLSDMNMPGDSGLQLITDVLDEYPDTAVVMVTGEDDAALARVALDRGAYGYVIKPFEPNEILINVANALRRRDLEIENRGHRERLEEMVRHRTGELWRSVQELEVAQKELRSSREETIKRLAMAAEFRDNETARHFHRMSRYCSLLAEKLGEDVQRCELIRLASVMHDVGKIGIPDRILLKPGKLDPEEWATMKTHAEIGYRILSGSNSELLKLGASIALTHHERMDGTGYPQGLVEDEIPLEGRIAAIADVFDALTTNRIYRRAFPLGEALDIMKKGRGDQFDPMLLDTFLASMDMVLGIKDKYDDKGRGPDPV